MFTMRKCPSCKKMGGRRCFVCGVSGKAVTKRELRSSSSALPRSLTQLPAEQASGRSWARRAMSRRKVRSRLPSWGRITRSRQATQMRRWRIVTLRSRRSLTPRRLSPVRCSVARGAFALSLSKQVAHALPILPQVQARRSLRLPRQRRTGLDIRAALPVVL